MYEVQSLEFSHDYIQRVEQESKTAEQDPKVEMQEISRSDN